MIGAVGESEKSKRDRLAKRDNSLKEIEKARLAILRAPRHKHHGTPLAEEHKAKILKVAMDSDADPEVIAAAREALALAPDHIPDCKHCG